MSARDLSDVDAQMQAPEAILGRAAERGRQMGLRYAGAVTPAEAHRLAGTGTAAIVDVRTRLEWDQVGHVAGARLIVWPRKGRDEEIGAFLKQLEEAHDPGEALLFICRSGVRSHYAAQVAAAAGFTRSYNVLEGFEGHPGSGDGWQAAGLPWTKG